MIVRLAGNLFRQMLRHHARIKIARRAGGSADDDLHLFAFEEIALRFGARNMNENEKK